MRTSYAEEQTGLMPGALYQSIRLGTFTHVYPYRPDQGVPPGDCSLRVARDTPGPVSITILMPEDDGGRVLPMNVVVVSDEIEEARPPAFLDEMQTILGQADIEVRLDRVLTLPGTGLGSITDFSEPQEKPGSMSAMLPGLVEGELEGPGLDVFLVDNLPSGVAGLSLGTPGPPVRGSYYFGVVSMRPASDAELARIIAHEASHFLALQHVENRGVSGEIYPDPLDDTAPGEGNLMENGIAITADQAWALGRSALLQTRCGFREF